MYDVIKSSTQTEETEDVNTQEDIYNTENHETSTKIKLQKGLGVIRKRKQQAIPCTRRYKVLCDPKFVSKNNRYFDLSSIYFLYLLASLPKMENPEMPASIEQS